MRVMLFAFWARENSRLMELLMMRRLKVMTSGLGITLFPSSSGMSSMVMILPSGSGVRPSR